MHETNGRNSLHWHASVHGGATPALLANVVGIPDLELVIANALDTVYRAWVPLDVHAVDAARRCLKIVGVKQTYSGLPTQPSDATSMTAFLREASLRGIQYGFHTHTQTCHIGKTGKF